MYAVIAGDDRMVGGQADDRMNALAFDTRERRLLTGASDGSVRMWNHNNGQLLKEMFHLQPAGEVTRVLHVADEERILQEYHRLSDALPDGLLSVVVDHILTDEEMHHFLLRTLSE